MSIGDFGSMFSASSSPSSPPQSKPRSLKSVRASVTFSNVAGISCNDINFLTSLGVYTCKMSAFRSSNSLSETSTVSLSLTNTFFRLRFPLEWARRVTPSTQVASNLPFPNTLAMCAYSWNWSMSLKDIGLSTTTAVTFLSYIQRSKSRRSLLGKKVKFSSITLYHIHNDL